MMIKATLASRFAQGIRFNKTFQTSRFARDTRLTKFKPQKLIFLVENLEHLLQPKILKMLRMSNFGFFALIFDSQFDHKYESTLSIISSQLGLRKFQKIHLSQERLIKKLILSACCLYLNYFSHENQDNNQNMIFAKIFITNFHKKNTKIVIHVLQKTADDERCLKKAQKQAIYKFKSYII